MGETILNDIYSLANDAKWYSGQVYEKVKNFLDKSISSTVTDIQNFSSHLQELTIQSLNNATNFLGNLSLDIQRTVNSVARSVYSIESTVAHIASDVISNISSKLNDVVDDLTRKIADVTQTLSIIIDSVTQEVRQSTSNIMSSLEATKDFLSNSIQEGTDIVREGISDLKDFSTQQFQTVITQANMNLITTLNTVEANARNILDQGVTLFDKTIDFVGQGITGLAQGFADLFENFQSFFTAQIKILTDDLKNIFMIDEDQLYAKMAKLTERFIQVQKANTRKDY